MGSSFILDEIVVMNRKSWSERWLLLPPFSSSDVNGDSLHSTSICSKSQNCFPVYFDISSFWLFQSSFNPENACYRITTRTLWETRVSPNVIYSMHHLRNDTSTLVVGGIDGVLRTVDQVTGEVISRCIMDDSTAVVHRSTERFGTIQIESRKLRRLSENDRIDLMPRTCKPQITCLAVGMEKVVTTHNDKYIRVWKFRKWKDSHTLCISAVSSHNNIIVLFLASDTFLCSCMCACLLYIDFSLLFSLDVVSNKFDIYMFTSNRSFNILEIN